MEEILDKYPLLKYQNVSRETCVDFEKFIIQLKRNNEEINLISKENSQDNTIRERHIVDSAQSIDFVDFNSNIVTDIGSGGGFPGIIVSILIKNLKKNIKVNLYEKSNQKSVFLRKIYRELKLETEVIQKNIFEIKNIKSGTIMARAFKPLPIVLDLVYKNFNNYKNLILFMGKNSEKILEDTLKIWDFDFEKKKKYHKSRFIFIKHKKY